MKSEMKSAHGVLSSGIATYDAIVVGAGYPGLITAAILSRNGLKTVVVDELDQIGGRFGNSQYNGYWLDWGHRDAKDCFSDNFLVITQPGQYGKKAIEAAGAEIALVGPITPNVRVHLRSGKIVSFSGEKDSLIEFAKEVLDLPGDKVESFLTLMGTLAQGDEEKFMAATMGDWLRGKADADVHNAFSRIAEVHFAQPVEENSVGRWMHSAKSAINTYKINDPEIGGLQGLLEAYARVVRKHGGEIKLGLQTVEISVKDKRVTGIVTRDKTNTVQEFHAPEVVFSLPFWEVLGVVDKSRFTPDVIENAQKVKAYYSRGDLLGLNIGVSRVPTVRATGQPEDYIGWNQFTKEIPDGWYIPTLSSEKQSPPGKHLVNILTSTPGTYASFEEAKGRLLTVHNYIRQYYSDLDEITEWASYQWYKIWATSNYWGTARRSPLKLDGLDGLYFAGSTTEVAGMFQDVEANSALQVAELILQRQKKGVK
ncbi:MAG: FAD-dependent oxidoreductase [Dehalococcoidia bacterium]